MKLSTFILCAIFICTFPRIQAFDRVYRPAEIIHAGDTLSGSKLPPNLNTLTINYRVRCKKIKPSASPRKLWKVIWCATSDHDFYEAEISYGSTAYGSVADDPALIIDINRIVGGACQSLHSSQLTTGVSTSHGANSLDIDLWNGRIYVRIGNGNTYTTLCDFEFESPSTLSDASIIAYEEIELIRERISALGDHRHAPADIDRLNMRLSRHDTEPVEGYWFYYDRKMPISKTKLGGYYSLAVVRSDVIPEAYDII
ncbi:MAG: hypothetical protein K2O12_03025, partial [Muribaculaceae bacterium]|nr:hypothetical protein [Muribaculaceae bacterium]